MRYLILLLLFSCNQQTPAPTLPTAPPVIPSPTPGLGKKLSLWATVYFVKTVNETPNGVKILDVNGKDLGVRLSNSDFCNAAIEGTFSVNGDTYNYHSSKAPNLASCSSRARSRARWFRTEHKYGVGNRSNALVPFKSIACDQKVFKFGQKFFIPQAENVTLPDGTIHDGIFICHDIGSAIRDNHIDVFVGMAKNDKDAFRFNFIKSVESGTFDAYLVE